MKYWEKQFFIDITRKLSYKQEQEELQQRLNKRKELEEKSRQWFLNEFNKTLELHNWKIIFAKDITEEETEAEVEYWFDYKNYA